MKDIPNNGKWCYNIFVRQLEAVDNEDSIIPTGIACIDYLVNLYRNGVSRRQVFIFFNKWISNFDIDTDRSTAVLELLSLASEAIKVSEAITSVDVDSVTEKLIDVVISCYNIATIFNADLDTVIDDKIQKDLRHGITSDRELMQ